ncbi:MAG: hypothetical protein US42_C0018G0033 [Candidatus Magasanikbacteria bacterium GW2011_GWC2_37_14]|uniref:Uncharacterized protein n=1 Tax=Candidatus Magasanikbacteria bacterium GW2011_GWC2_37_14 TaxID=1619046 RepID=A0A0G0IS11_9BACT|nr:MAG: hypothetical protein US42_C0018G0033 [Candidatus Magasanikbacteria bacterium GW2011_GWC2_37_14]
MPSFEQFEPAHVASAVLAGELKLTKQGLFFGGVLLDDPRDVQVVMASLDVAIKNSMAGGRQIEEVLKPLQAELLAHFPQPEKKVEVPPVEKRPLEQWTDFMVDWQVAVDRAILIAGDGKRVYINADLRFLDLQMKSTVNEVLDSNTTLDRLLEMKRDLDALARSAPRDGDWRKRFKSLLESLLAEQIGIKTHGPMDLQR